MSQTRSGRRFLSSVDPSDSKISGYESLKARPDLSEDSHIKMLTICWSRQMRYMDNETWEEKLDLYPLLAASEFSLCHVSPMKWVNQD